MHHLLQQLECCGYSLLVSLQHTKPIFIQGSSTQVRVLVMSQVCIRGRFASLGLLVAFLLIQSGMRLAFADRAGTAGLCSTVCCRPQVFFCKATFEPVGSQPVLLHGVICRTVCSQERIDAWFAYISTNTHYCCLQSAEIFLLNSLCDTSIDTAKIFV